jgi:hypothetical protein
MTFAEIETLVRQESDTENDPHIGAVEIQNYINLSRLELYDLLVTRYGDDYFTANAIITTNGTDQEYPLPNGTLYSNAPAFYKGMLAEVRAFGNPGVANQPVWISLIKFNLREKNRYNLMNQALVTGYMWPRYRLMGSKIMFQPLPNAGMTIRLWYAPKLTPLVLSDDVAEDWGGWLEYVIVDAALKCVQKQERDPSLLAARKGSLLARIEAAAQNRDLGEPNTVTETQPGEMGGGPYSGGPFGGFGPWG